MRVMGGAVMGVFGGEAVGVFVHVERAHKHCAGLLQAGLACDVSQSAGTFVCNHVFYGLMHRLSARTGVRGGFMHIPLLPEQAARHPGYPFMRLETMVHGVRQALQLALRHTVDLRAAGGTVA